MHFDCHFENGHEFQHSIYLLKISLRTDHALPITEKAFVGPLIIVMNMVIILINRGKVVKGFQ